MISLQEAQLNSRYYFTMPMIPEYEEAKLADATIYKKCVTVGVGGN